MAQEGWIYDGTTWREATEVYFYDGTTWQEATEGWVYDGTTWNQWWTIPSAILNTAFASIGDDGGDGCGVGKCQRCVAWTTTDASDSEHHIRILRSLSGGSYLEQVDDLSIDATCGSCSTAGCSSAGVGNGCWCDGSCIADGQSTQYRVRLENDGTDDLTGTSVEKTTGAVETCGAEA